MRLTGKSRLATVAMAVGDALRRHGIEGVLTGGACASLLTDEGAIEEFQLALRAARARRRSAGAAGARR